jgi:hypothetical protein
LRFFTQAWHRGELPDEKPDSVLRAYQAHIEAISSALPRGAVRLATDVSLHDGLLRRVRCDSRSLELMIRAGDQRHGYFDAQLSYGGTEVTQEDLRFLQDSVGRRDVELLYDEFDLLSEHRWEQRMLFWPYREITVMFETLGLQVTPASDRFSEGAA